ncbi:MAG: uracil-DNA glycosylase, partial [Kangiella sp.]|nr:uracil-DNA glycosylase [Kangiella sp.]
CTPPSNGDLSHWAKQGVLLLNTVLTVEAGKANSHKGRGWEVFTDHIIKSLNHTSQPIVFLLWGSQAKAKSSLINNPKHTILSAPHPSPLSAHRGFFGSHHFSKTNQILVENHQTPIEWV